MSRSYPRFAEPPFINSQVVQVTRPVLERSDGGDDVAENFYLSFQPANKFGRLSGGLQSDIRVCPVF